MTELEQQTDEIEALTSIYEGDTCFKQVSSTTFTYKVNIRKFLENKFSKIFIFSTARTIATIRL